MRKLKSILITLLMTVSVLTATAKTQTYSSNGFSIKATDGVTNNGKEGIMFTIAVDVPGPYSGGGWLIVYLCDNNHDYLKVDGETLKVWKELNLPYKVNSFEHTKIFLPYSKLREAGLSRNSSFTFFVNATRKGGNKDLLKQSGWNSWKGSSSKSSTPTKPAPKKNKNKSHTEQYGNVTIKHKQLDGDSEIIITTIPCIFCHSSGKCGGCHGLGKIYWPGLGSYQPCSMCGSSGNCPKCNGTKEFTSYMTRVGGLYFDQNGKIIVSPDIKSEYERDRYNRIKRCKRCGGTGIDKFPMHEEDPVSASSDAAMNPGTLGYYHTDHSKCRYCGKYSWHTHMKCSDCNH